jgi:hypothetical protein
MEFGNFDIYTSTNGGENISKVFTLPYFITYPSGLGISGPVALLGGLNPLTNSGYLYKSLDGGLTWSVSIDNIPDTYFASVSLEVIYGKDLVTNVLNPVINNITAMAAALDMANSTCKIYYITTILDATWRQSTEINTITPITGSFNSVFLFERFGIAGSASDTGLYYSINFGQTWLHSNIQSGIFNSVYLSGFN